MLPKPEPRVCAHRWGICEARSAVAVLGSCPRFADNVVWFHRCCEVLAIVLLPMQRHVLLPQAVIGLSEHGQDARATAGCLAPSHPSPQAASVVANGRKGSPEGRTRAPWSGE